MADRPDEQPERNDPDISPSKGRGGPVGPGGDGGMRFSRSMLGWILIVAVAVLIFALFHDKTPAPVEKDWTTFWKSVDLKEMTSVELKDDGTIVGTRRDDVAGRQLNESNRWFVNIPPSAVDGPGLKMLADRVQSGGGNFKYVKTNSVLVQFFITLLPYLLLFLLIWFFFLRQIRSAGGGMGMLGNFGRSKHRLLNKEHTNITFADVAGIDEAKEELAEIVEFLRNPKRFQKLGGRIPRGVLLVGDPGVGKTLLAKAIAGEADVPFFSISGSDFVEMFVGVGASRVRDLFKTAKESSPCIIFLDEIDAVGRRRQNDPHGGSQESAQTLNAILVEMDGFDTNDQVIVIAATNRSDVLDPALTRPGRFDRQVYVPLPDIKGRYEILKVHARKVKLSSNADLMRLARQTPMFSGADLAAIINEAALTATMLNKESIEMVDLEESRDKLRFGKARRNRVIDEKEKIMIAWHEAGHAIIQALQPDADPLHKVTIISRGRFGGASFTLPEKDRMTYSRNFMLAELRILYGGRVAEELYVGDISTGASNDIMQASHMARAMVCDYGMSTLGPIKFSPDENRNSYIDLARDYSEKTAEQIDVEVHRFITTAYEEARQILMGRKAELEALKDALLKYETLDAEDVKKILAGQAVTKPTVADLINAEALRRAGEARRETERREPGPDGAVVPQPG